MLYDSVFLLYNALEALNARNKDSNESVTIDPVPLSCENGEKYSAGPNITNLMREVKALTYFPRGLNTATFPVPRVTSCEYYRLYLTLARTSANVSAKKRKIRDGGSWNVTKHDFLVAIERGEDHGADNDIRKRSAGVLQREDHRRERRRERANRVLGSGRSSLDRQRAGTRELPVQIHRAEEVQDQHETGE